MLGKNSTSSEKGMWFIYCIGLGLQKIFENYEIWETLYNFAREVDWLWWSAIYGLYVSVMVSLAFGIYTCADATHWQGNLFCNMIPSQVKSVRIWCQYTSIYPVLLF